MEARSGTVLTLGHSWVRGWKRGLDQQAETLIFITSLFQLTVFLSVQVVVTEKGDASRWHTSFPHLTHFFLILVIGLSLYNEMYTLSLAAPFPQSTPFPSLKVHVDSPARGGDVTVFVWT